MWGITPYGVGNHPIRLSMMSLWQREHSIRQACSREAGTCVLAASKVEEHAVAGAVVLWLLCTSLLLVEFDASRVQGMQRHSSVAGMVERGRYQPTRAIPALNMMLHTAVQLGTLGRVVSDG
jgi:hypothetical protein